MSYFQGRLFSQLHLLLTTLLFNRSHIEGNNVQNSFTWPTGSHPRQPDGGMLPSHSGIIARTIHKGENVLLLRGIELGLPKWELVTTTTMLPNTDKSYI